MQQPIKGTRVLGVDPGIRTGTKCAALDSTGKYLGSFVIYQHKPAEGERAILKAIKDYDVQLVAIGNGTGTREVQEIVAKVISEHCPSVLYTVVDEDGASVYSASDIAREEFPELDLTIRGHFIGRACRIRLLNSSSRSKSIRVLTSTILTRKNCPKCSMRLSDLS